MSVGSTAERTLDAGIQQFLDHLKVERQLAAATLEAYGRDLGSFARFAVKRGVTSVDQVRSIDILDHCRGEGPHARGCWVVDLVLGKE